MSQRVHGGPDASGPARWDFSTCANAAGPCPQALEAIRAADPTRYPDPQSVALRQALAELHNVDPQRILLAASASEFIQRITAVSARLRPGSVSVSRHSYGDYAAAAAAWQRPVHDEAATLRWFTDPSSPLGQDAPPPADPAAIPTVLDAVYGPLRLIGQSPWTEAARDAVFVMHSPNKALGLTGVRGAYAVAPLAAAYDVTAWCEALEAATPSWPLSAHAHAMLQSWTQDTVQAWVRQSHAQLAGWKAQLEQRLAARGFELSPSVTPYLCVRPPSSIETSALRPYGVAVRDASSFGLDGWWRVSAQAPQGLDALERALDAATEAS